MQTVLVIDDSPEILEVVAAILEEHSFQVVCATDAKRAMKLCEDVQFDVVLCDLCLDEGFPSGGKSSLIGLRTINYLIEQYPSTPVIAMSGIVRQERLSSVGFLPLAGVLPKPFTSDALVSKLRAAMH